MDKDKISDVKVEGIDLRDHPKYCDAYISSAKYNGEKMNDKQLDEINKDMLYVNESVIETLIR